MLLEGLVMRQLDNGMVACTILNSYPLNPIYVDCKSDFLSASSSELIVDDDGYFTNAAEEAANDRFKVFSECLGEQAVRASQEQALKATGLLRKEGGS